MFLTFTIAKIINSIVLLFLSMYYFCGRNGKEYTRQGFGSHNAPYHSPGHSIHAQDIKRKDNRHDATRGRRETYDRFYHGEQGPAGISAPEVTGPAPARRKIGVTGYDIPLAYLPHRAK